MRLSIHRAFKFSSIDDSIKDPKAAATILPDTDKHFKEEAPIKVSESYTSEDKYESSKSDDPGATSTQANSSEPEREALSVFSIARANIDAKNGEITIVAQAEKYGVILNEDQNSAAESGNEYLPSFDDNEATDWSPPNIIAEGICNENSINGESETASNTNWSVKSESKLTTVASESFEKSRQIFSTSDQICDNSPSTSEALPIHQSNCSYDSSTNSRSPQLITSVETTTNGNEHTLIGLETSEPDVIEIQAEKELSMLRDHASSSGSEDPELEGSTHLTESLVVDFTAVNSPDFCIGQSCPINLPSPKRSLLQETNSRGFEPDQDVNVKTATLTTETLEDSSGNDGNDVWVPQDDIANLPLTDKKDLQAEYKPPLSYQGLMEDEIVKSPTESRTPSHRDEKLSVDDCEDHQEKDYAETAQIHKSPQLQLEGSITRTRSGTRFSDDTNMLKEFLNREKARKAAKELQAPVYAPAPMISPRRSSRKAPADIAGNSPSPQKPCRIANRPGTPPGKQKLRAIEVDDPDEVTTEPSSCRRSTRTRLFTPAKTTSDVPSFIPVRRADGADTIVLQKSLAQELAIVTRSNTRRNKGQSKPPKLTLQTLSAESLDDATMTSMRKPNPKSVSWDEALVSCCNASDSKEGKEEKRPKMRKLSSRGAVHSTPAAKKLTSELSSSQGASAAKRGSQSR